MENIASLRKVNIAHPYLEEEGGAEVAGGKGEQADEGDERHGGGPPGFQIKR